MLKRLRKRIIFITMLIVILSVFVIFGILYASTRQNMLQQSEGVLERIISEPMFTMRPGERHNNEIQLPYFVVYIANGQVALGANSNYTIDDETLLYIVEKAYSSAEEKGRIEEYSLRYLTRHSGFGTTVAFVDISLEISALRSLVITSSLIGCGVVLAFFVLILMVSKRIVAPIEEAFSIQRRFVADASHELKTPLTVILANAAMLSEDTQTDTEQYRRVSNINEEGRRMRTLVESLLEQARVDSEDRKQEFKPVDLSYIMSESILTFEPVAYEAGRSLSAEIAENIFILGDEQRLHQLAAILLDNAVKYSYENTEIRVTLQMQGRKSVYLRVYDVGEPIPEEGIDKIFRRFYRSDKARSADGSYGLGLSIAQQIVSAHGGEISAESSQQQTVFSVTLPVKGEKKRI